MNDVNKRGVLDYFDSPEDSNHLALKRINKSLHRLRVLSNSMDNRHDRVSGARDGCLPLVYISARTAFENVAQNASLRSPTIGSRQPSFHMRPTATCGSFHPIRPTDGPCQCEGFVESVVASFFASEFPIVGRELREHAFPRHLRGHSIGSGACVYLAKCKPPQLVLKKLHQGISTPQ